jgi:hypothetical protein
MSNSNKDDLESSLELDDVIEFLEPDAEAGEDFGGVTEFVEEADNDALEVVDVSDVAEGLSDLLSPELSEDIGNFISEYEEEVSDKIIVPGASDAFMGDDDDSADLEIPAGSWGDDRAIADFMRHLGEAYPSGIPEHDGNSMLGCEKAIIYLSKLNNEISEAVRLDSGDDLDVVNLEDYRVKIMSDIVLLKNRLSSLKKKLNESERGRISSASNMSKTATTPILQVIVTPFERAVAGIIVNSVVSGGKPFEDVYEHLKKKYDLSIRDELSIMQILMDGGYHIFKDRGSIGSDPGDLDAGGNPDLHGLDFIKNYFA